MHQISLAMLLAFMSQGAAEMTLFNADFKGSNEVPPSQTTGTETFTATYDSVTKRLSWKGSYWAFVVQPRRLTSTGFRTISASRRV